MMSASNGKNEDEWVVWQCFKIKRFIYIYDTSLVSVVCKRSCSLHSLLIECERGECVYHKRANLERNLNQKKESERSKKPQYELDTHYTHTAQERLKKHVSYHIIFILRAEREREKVNLHKMTCMIYLTIIFNDGLHTPTHTYRYVQRRVRSSLLFLLLESSICIQIPFLPNVSCINNDHNHFSVARVQAVQ